jgi:hypothetical protein
LVGQSENLKHFSWVCPRKCFTNFYVNGSVSFHHLYIVFAFFFVFYPFCSIASTVTLKHFCPKCFSRWFCSVSSITASTLFPLSCTPVTGTSYSTSSYCQFTE